MKEIRLLACGAMTAFCVLPCLAKTVLWYHFDESPAGTKTSNSKTSILNAVDQTALVGTCHCFWQDLALFCTENPPVYSNSFARGLSWYDPVSGVRGSDTTSLHFPNARPGDGAGHRGSVIVHDASALKLKTFTAEAFVKDVTLGACKYERTFFFFESYVSTAEGNPGLGVNGHNDGKIAWRLYSDKNGKLGFYMSGPREGSPGSYVYPYTQNDSSHPGGGAPVNNAPAVLTDGNWHHIAMTVDNAAKTVKLYVDYIEVFSDTLFAEVPYESNYFFLGTTGSKGGGWGGLMDEVRISDAVLTPLQMLRPVAPKTDADTILYLPFENGFGWSGWTMPGGKYSAAFPNEAPGASVLRIIKRKLGSVESPLTADDLPATQLRDGIADRAAAAENPHAINLVTGEDANRTGTVFTYDDTARRIMSGSFTAELFFRAEIAAPGPYGTCLLSETAGRTDSWYVNFGRDGKLAFCARNQSGTKYQEVATAKTYNDSKWHHIAYVWDKPAQEVRFYVDYGLVGTISGIDQLNDAAGVTGWDPPYDANLWIGGRFNGDKGYAFHHHGQLDEVRITQRALDPQEFLTGAASGYPLLAKVDFEDNAKVAPYADVLNAGVLSAGASYWGRVPLSPVVENGGTIVEAANTKSVSIQNGTVTFGRNLPLEKAKSYVVEFYMKAKSVSPGAKILDLGSWSLSKSASSDGFVLTADTDEENGQTVAFPGVGTSASWFAYAISVATVNGETTMSLSCNGKLIASQPLNGELKPTSALVLGSSGFTGAFDELRITEGTVDPESMLFCPDPKGIVLILR